MFSGHGAFMYPGGISPWRQFVDLAHGPAIDEAGENVGEPSLGIDGVEMGWLPPSPDGIAMCQESGVYSH
jgi:hypothetical protein